MPSGVQPDGRTAVARASSPSPARIASTAPRCASRNHMSAAFSSTARNLSHDVVLDMDKANGELDFASVKCPTVYAWRPARTRVPPQRR